MEQLIAFCEVFGKPLAILLGGLLVMLFVVRPLLKLLGTPPKKGGTAGRGGSGRAQAPLSKKEIDALAEELEASLGGRKPTLSDQEKISRLAQSDPERAKELVRRWLRQ
ncbi:MAG: hypothetical protein OEV73_04110 [Desulfobulbaceae bacterium]|nr:hypothetical protein [Desulfobulbaceae bacterium]